MNWSVILGFLTTLVANIQTFAIANKFVLTLFIEILAVLALIWGVAYHPRVCIVVALAAYLLNRYGSIFLTKPEA